MTLRRVLIVWAGLLGLVLCELLAPLLHANLAAPFLGLAMTAVVVAVPMELPKAPNASLIFALAGAFWLVVVLFGLGTLDPLTRHQAPSWFDSARSLPTNTGGAVP